MSDTDSIRRRLLGGGLLTVALVGVLLLLVGVPAGALEIVPFAWLTAGGALLLIAGRYERLSLGTTSVGWPQIAAVGLAILAIGSSTVGFLGLLIGPGGWGLVQAAVSLVVSLVLAVGALECWLGGAVMDEATFAVE